MFAVSIKSNFPACGLEVEVQKRQYLQLIWQGQSKEIM